MTAYRTLLHDTLMRPRREAYPLLAAKASTIPGVDYEAWDDRHEINLFIRFLGVGMIRAEIDALAAIIEAHETAYTELCGLQGALVVGFHLTQTERTLLDYAASKEIRVFGINPAYGLREWTKQCSTQAQA